MTTSEALQHLESLADPSYIAKMEHFGIKGAVALGIRTPVLRNLAKEIGKDQQLSNELWKEAPHEAKLLSIFLMDPKQLSEEIMDQRVIDFYSWDLVDQFCTPFGKKEWTWDKAMSWSKEEPEFMKRAGFVLVVAMCIHNKKMPDDRLVPFFQRMEEEAWDGRNFVKKAVNWSLRTLGKRSLYLHSLAIASAERILAQDTPAARWIANDALRELKSDKIVERLHKKAK